MKETIIHCPTKELREKVIKKMISDGYKLVTGEGVERYTMEYISAEADGMIRQGSQDWKNNSISAQEYLGEPKQLTHSEFLAYIKEHGATKAMITEDYSPGEDFLKAGSIHDIFLEVDYDGEQLKSNEEDGTTRVWSPYPGWAGYLGKFELVEEPFEDKSAREQGIEIDRYFTVIGDDSFYKGDLLRLEMDDGDEYPYLERIEDGQRDYTSWKNLRYATQSEIDKVLGEKVMTDEEKEDYWGVCGYKGELSAAFQIGVDFGVESKPINQSFIKKTMNKVTKFIKNATLSADDKLLRENGLMDECGNFTQSYHDIKELITDEEYKEKVVAQLKATLEAEKEK